MIALIFISSIVTYFIVDYPLYPLFGLASAVVMLAGMWKFSNFKKNTTYKQLMMPRAIYAASLYLVVIFGSLKFDQAVFEHLLLCAISMSVISFHPFYSEWIRKGSFILSILLSIGIMAMEIFMGNVYMPLGIENYIFIIYMFSVISAEMYLINDANKKFRERMRNNRSQIQSKLYETNTINEKINHINTRFANDFLQAMGRMEARFQEIIETTDEKPIQNFATQGKQSLADIHNFIEAYQEENIKQED